MCWIFKEQYSTPLFCKGPIIRKAHETPIRLQFKKKKREIFPCGNIRGKNGKHQNVKSKQNN